MNSLERRLQFGLAVALVVLIGLFWVVGSQALRSMTENWVASRLQHDTEGLLAAMVVQPENVKIRWRRVNQVFSQPLSGHYYVIRFDDDDDDTIRSRSLWDQSLEIKRLLPGESEQQVILGPSNQKLLLLLSGFEKQGRQFTLGIAEDMTPIYAEYERFMRWFALLAVASLTVLLLVQHFVIRRTLKPLDAVREEIRQLEQGEADALGEAVPSEVLPLVQEFNHLLRLLARRLERSRNGLGNLAHALKGPLNLLMQYFDRLESSDGSESPHPQARMQAQRIKQLMDRELRRARLAGKELSSQRFNPKLELPDLIAVLGQMHRARSIDITYQVDESVEVFGDREDMLELLGNLLDNACKWATSTVQCSIQGGEVISIQVSDDGGGLNDEDIHTLTQRGVRLDENVEGHGLGLAIIGDIVKLYGGTLKFYRAHSLGGLCVEVQLPCKSGTA